MSFYEEWVEADLNPIITFASSGRITYTNNEAQFLLNRIKSKEIFDLAMKYAPMNFGFHTTYINLSISNYTFYAVTVGYKDEENITIKLYKSIMVKKEASFNTNGEFANIFTIVDLGISTQKIKRDIKYLKEYDPSIPEFKIIVSEFLKLLNSIFESFEKSTYIKTLINFKTGEYLRINGKKYSLVTVILESDGNIGYNYDKLDKYSNPNWQLTLESNSKIAIDLPLVLK